MRMYNPEWEAIKDFEHVAHCREAQFDLVGLELPEDHGFTLYEEIVRHLPWLRQTPEAGIHPVHGAPNGRNTNLVINHRVKLVLRLPIDRLEAAKTLEGKHINPGSGDLRIGSMKAKPLTPYTTLYSPFVALGTTDEANFIAAVRRELEDMDIRCGLIPGKKRSMHTPNGVIGGYSLMLHDVGLLQSLAIQERGLGLHRGYGCGIFIPHKSIKEVGGG